MMKNQIKQNKEVNNNNTNILLKVWKIKFQKKLEDRELKEKKTKNLPQNRPRKKEFNMKKTKNWQGNFKKRKKETKKRENLEINIAKKTRKTQNKQLKF